MKLRPYDVVLMDMHMPEMDGLSATKAIRGMRAPVASVPIVALTANAFTHDIENCKEAGMSGHLGKPFHTDQLIVTLASALNGTAGFGKTAVAFLPDDQAATIDWDVIERFRADSGEEMLRLLIDTFMSDTAKKLGTLASIARHHGDDREALRIAHSLKSSGAMSGAGAFSLCAGALEEKLSLDGPVESADADRLVAHFEKYRAALAARGLAA